MDSLVKVLRYKKEAFGYFSDLGFLAIPLSRNMSYTCGYFCQQKSFMTWAVNLWGSPCTVDKKLEQLGAWFWMTRNDLPSSVQGVLCG
jgi:hypothetical protein